MEWLNAASNLAQLFCLPATIAAIPGLIAVFSEKMRKWLGTYRWIPLCLIGILVISVIVDAGLRIGIIPQIQFTHIENIYGRHYKDVWVILDNKRFYNCFFDGNVVLSWNGGAIMMNNCASQGSIMLSSSNATVKNTVALLGSLGLLSVDIRTDVIPAEKAGHILPDHFPPR